MNEFIPAHEIAASLGPTTVNALPDLHAITGCDTTSRLHRKYKSLPCRQLSKMLPLLPMCPSLHQVAVCFSHLLSMMLFPVLAICCQNVWWVSICYPWLVKGTFILQSQCERLEFTASNRKCFLHVLLAYASCNLSGVHMENSIRWLSQYSKSPRFWMDIRWKPPKT